MLRIDIASVEVVLMMDCNEPYHEMHFASSRLKSTTQERMEAQQHREFLLLLSGNCLDKVTSGRQAILYR